MLSGRTMSFSWALPVVALAMAASCSRESVRSDVQSEPASSSFQEWCSAWNLSCPQGPAANMPIPDAPWSVQQWQAAFRSLKGIASSPSQISFSREEFGDPRLKTVAEAFEMGGVLDSFRARLDENGLDSVRLANDGSIRLRFASPGEWETPHGIRVHHDAEAILTVEDSGTVRFTGFSLSSAASPAPQALVWARVSATNVFDVGISGMTITQAPIAFVLDELIGDFRLPSSTDALALDKLAGAIAPLRGWLARSDRSVRLERSFLAKLAADLPLLVNIPGQPDLGQTLASVVGALGGVETGWHRTNGAFLTASVMDGRKLRCRIEGAPIVMEFTSNFGLRDLGGTSDRAWMEFFGMKTKIDLPGPLDPSFDLERVEMTSEKLIIKNVPVIGEYALNLSDFSQPGGETKKFVCGTN